MKKGLIVSLAAMVMAFGCEKAADKKAAAEDVQHATFAKVEIAVPTVQCESCSKNITKSLAKVKGVKKTSIDLDAKVATIQYDESVVKLADMENAIAEAGYAANETKAVVESYNALDSCCKVKDGEEKKK